MPVSNKILPFMTGRHGRLVFAQGRVRKTIPFETWSIKPIVVKHTDQVNGEKRARLDRQLDYYEITASAFMQDAEVIRTYLEAQAEEDAGVTPIDQEGGVRFYPRNGTSESFIFEDLSWDDFDVNQGGRTAKMKVTFNMRCTNVKEAKTI